MNEIEKMIESLCPDGVEFRELGEVAIFIRGVTYSKSKEVHKYTEEHWKVLRANNITLSSNTLNFDDVKLILKEVKVREEQILKKDDILICTGSGSKEHIGKVAYISKDMEYTFGGFMGVIRCSGCLYSRFLLTGVLFRKHLEIMLNSTTINNLNSQIMNSFKIPIPPLEIQEKIVKVLDIFTELEATLEAELSMRKKQYEYYRNKLLTFDNITDKGDGSNSIWQRLAQLCPQGVPMVALGEIGTFIRGSGLQKKDFVESGVGCIHYGQIYTYYGTFTHTTKSFVSEEFAKKAKMASFGDLVMATTSENVSDVCKVVAWLGKESIVISGDALIIKHNQNAKYMAYLFQTKHFLDFKKMYATGIKVIRISTDNLKKYKFYLPPLEIQQMIVDILDKFDKLVNDLTTGLPAEINARRQQYEYYRERLLSFRERN